MQLHAAVIFDDDEVDLFRRALGGHQHAIVLDARNKKEDAYLPVRVHLNRIAEHRERYDLDSLNALDETLLRLLVKWQPETTAAYWQTMAPPLTGEDAIAGLALERSQAIRRVNDCRLVISLAREIIRRLTLVSECMNADGLAAAMNG
jgi:hypothetical protein